MSSSSAMKGLVLLCLLVVGATAIEVKRDGKVPAADIGPPKLIPSPSGPLINKMKLIVDDAEIPYSFKQVAAVTHRMRKLLKNVERRHKLFLGSRIADFENAILRVPEYDPRGEEYNKALRVAEDLYDVLVGHLTELERIPFDVEMMNLRMMAKNKITGNIRLNIVRIVGASVPYDFGRLIKELSKDYHIGASLGMNVNKDVQGVLDAASRSSREYIAAIKKLNEKLKNRLITKAEKVIKDMIKSAEDKNKKENKEKKENNEKKD